MQRPGINENDVQMSDILCDFCHGEWTMQRPMVEGHRGACICGDCLHAACRTLLIEKISTAPKGTMCSLCREVRDEVAWSPPSAPPPLAGHTPDGPLVACRRCVHQSAAVLAKDKDYGWQRPQAPTT